MLIALPKLDNTLFRKALVYVHTYSKNGAAGFLMNWQMENEAAETHSHVINWPNPELMYHGGPVNSGVGYVIHTNDYNKDSTVPFNNYISYTMGQDIIVDIKNKVGPSKFLLAFGYCGWKPGQLENEIENHGSWAITNFDNDFLWQNLAKEDYWKYSIGLMAKNETARIFEKVKKINA